MTEEGEHRMLLMALVAMAVLIVVQAGIYSHHVTQQKVSCVEVYSEKVVPIDRDITMEEDTHVAFHHERFEDNESEGDTEGP